jgi:hypothetical protein
MWLAGGGVKGGAVYGQNKVACEGLEICKK